MLKIITYNLKGRCNNLEKSYINKPYWSSINEVPYIYPWLSHDETAQVCIIGGGITGALSCLKFVSAGIDTVLISADPIAYSSTAKSYGIMQLQVDRGLYRLSHDIGLSNATEIYNLCKTSIDEIEKICYDLPKSCGFKRVNSFLFTKEKSSNEFLQKEYMLLKNNGFDVSFVTKDKGLETFPFEIESGIILHKLAAIVDPYLLTHEIIKKCESLGARIYENSHVKSIGTNYAVTNTGQKVTADKIISATGLNTYKFFKDLGIKKTRFAVVSKPIDNLSDLGDTNLFNCIDTPKISFAVTPDNRISAYGLDAGMVEPFKKISNAFCSSSSANKFENKKFDSLSEGLSYYFPGFCSASPEYAFTTDYIQTEHGLPIIDEIKNFNNCLCGFCSGSSSLVFSNIVANILFKIYKGELIAKSNFLDYLK